MQAVQKFETRIDAESFITLLKSKNIYSCMSGCKTNGYEVLVASGNIEKVKECTE